jgi:hypothetical protein
MFELLGAGVEDIGNDDETNRVSLLPLYVSDQCMDQLWL